jgi:hypothetical protein
MILSGRCQSADAPRLNCGLPVGVLENTFVTSGKYAFKV